MPHLDKALLSLDGLSVGDGFGARLGEGRNTPQTERWLASRRLPPGPWPWTDDTAMALSIVENLDAFGAIQQDELADAFAMRFVDEPHRGYGAGAYRLLYQVAAGRDWRDLAPKLFEGGSYGNGAAMRIAPLGGFLAGDPKRAAAEARKSAMVTHTHPEGQAGAVAVAVAAALAASPGPPADLLAAVLPYTPDSDVRDGIRRATGIPPDRLEEAIKALGTGWRVSAQDTVPFCLWVAAHHAADYPAALWATAEGIGDRDTTCAIVGGIVALSAGGVPAEWLKRREPLPEDFTVFGE